MSTILRPIAAIDADIEAASDALVRAREEATDVGTNLARLVAGFSERIADGLAAEKAAWEAAEARLQALLAEREAALEEQAIRALLPEAAALATRPPPPEEAAEPLRDAVGVAGQLVAALERASAHLVAIAPLGDSSLTYTSNRPGDTFQAHVHDARRSLEEAEQLHRELLAAGLTVAGPPIPAFPSGLAAFYTKVRGAHRMGVAAREAHAAYAAIRDALAARREASERARRLLVAWERTRSG